MEGNGMHNGWKTCRVNSVSQNWMDFHFGILGRMPNWKSPGPDLVQGFCLKNLGSFHGRERAQLKECLDSGFMPSWLTNRRPTLLQKYCLPLMWTLLLLVIADQIYGHLDQQKLVPEEQKGCRKRSRGTNDLLYIDGAVIVEVKSRKKISNGMARL